MAVVEFFVVVGRFLGGDVEVTRGFVHGGRVSRVREVRINEVADLPEESVGHL